MRCKHCRLPIHRIGIPAVGEYVSPSGVGVDVGDFVAGDEVLGDEVEGVVGVTVGDIVVGVVVVGVVVGGNVNVPPGICTHKGRKCDISVVINSSSLIL